VLVAGYPYGELFTNTIKVTKGIVSANKGMGDDRGLFQIDVAQQGRGYGQLFIQALPALLEREYPEKHGVCLTVNCENRHAYDLYQLGGFVGSESLYHGGRSGPQHVMQRSLGPEHG